MRVCNVEKIDNGFIVQRVVAEGETGEGIQVTQDPAEALSMVAALLGVAVAIKTAPEAPAAPTGTIPFPGPATPPPAAPPAEQPPQGQGSYDEEIDRIVAVNDRKEAHKRLDALVKAGVIQDYNKRLGIEKLSTMLVEGDKQAQLAAGNTPPPAAGPTLPSGAALPPGVPPPTPGSVGVVLKDLTDALQRLAQTDPKEGPKKAFAIIQGYGAANASGIPADKWPEAIANADLQAGA